MDSFSKVPEQQRPELIRHLEEQQMKDSLKLYNHLVESCFDKCVHVGWSGGFKSKQLDDTESKCVSQCAEKYMKLTQRVGFRFAEFNQQAATAPSSPSSR